MVDGEIKKVNAKKEARMKKRAKRRAERIASRNAKKEAKQNNTDDNAEVNNAPVFSTGDYQMSATQLLINPADGAGLMNTKYITS